MAENRLGMKIQICSDLHLEFPANRKWLKENPLMVKGDILVLAEDTYYLDRNFKELDFINRVAGEFEQVYLIPGNHEYYGGFDVSTALGPSQMSIKENVTLLNNSVIEWQGVQLIFSTFWSLIQHHIFPILSGMADFKLIKFNQKKLTIAHYNQLHEKAFEFVQQAVQKEGKKVVVTHHLPSNLCNVEEFKNSVINEAFCVEKTNFILDQTIDYWIYGHSHRNKKDFKIGQTAMVTNQLGYVGWKEHHSFDRGRVIEV